MQPKYSHDRRQSFGLTLTTRAIAAALVYAKNTYMKPQCTLSEILEQVMADIESQGLDCLSEFPQGDLVFFRRFELAAALNRLRSLKVSTNSRILSEENRR